MFGTVLHDKILHLSYLSLPYLPLPYQSLPYLLSLSYLSLSYLIRLAREQRRINDANAPSGRESGVPRRGDARCGSEDRGNNASAPSGRQSGVQRREDARRGSDEGGNGGRVGRYLTSRDRNRLIDPDPLNNGRGGERDGEAVTPPRMTGRERTPEDAGRRDMNESASRSESIWDVWDDLVFFREQRSFSDFVKVVIPWHGYDIDISWT